MESAQFRIQTYKGPLSYYVDCVSEAYRKNKYQPEASTPDYRKGMSTDAVDLSRYKHVMQESADTEDEYFTQEIDLGSKPENTAERYVSEKAKESPKPLVEVTA